jgi:8-oxo-dGTP pyrophosphatase MutT (NUDIX family)
MKKHSKKKVSKSKKKPKGKYRKAFFCVVYLKTKGILGKKKLLYLVLKRKLHWDGWEFPKGGLDGNESVKKGLLREIKEETGQIPHLVSSYPISGKFKYKGVLSDRPGIIGQTYRLFSAQITAKKINFDPHEHSQYKWVEYRKALKLLEWPNQRKCLKIVHKDLVS